MDVASPHPRAGRRTIGALGIAALGLLVSAGLALGLAAPAAAHDRLVSTSPADGAVLELPPALVELTFSGEVADLGSALVIEDASGTPVQSAPPTIVGTVVRSPLPPDVGPGTYLVRWRVVAQDGHPIEGTFGFTVSDAAAVTDSATATPTDSSTGAVTDSATATGSRADTSSATTGPALADAGDPAGRGSGLVPLLGGLLAAGGVAGVVVALVRRRRS